MEKFEFAGIWWVPNNYENYIHGILKFNSEDGAYLELMGNILDYEELQTDIILGKTANGKNITLYKCFYIKKTLISSEINTSIVFANIVFEGVHFNRVEDIRFTELSCHYSNLDEWAWMKGINIISSSQDKIEISYDYPTPIKVEVSKDYTVALYAITQTPSYSIVQKEASIKQKIYIKLINKELNSFEEHSEKLNHIKNLVSLGVGGPISIIDFIGKTEENKEEFKGDTIYTKVKIYFATKYSTNAYKEILPPRMLFTFRDIKDDFDSVIKKWFNKKQNLGPVFDLYFGTIYNSDMYLEQKFLSLIQALESYHRRTKPNNEISPEKHEERIKIVIDSVDDNYRKWIKTKLKYSNEPSLRNRLKELVEGCDTLLNLPSGKKKKSFISKVYDTRNYLTHYDTSLESKAAKKMELFDICTRLKIIIEFNLLLEVGLNCGKTHKLLEEKYRQYDFS